MADSFFSMILNFLACFVVFFLLMQTRETSNSSLVKSSPSRFYIFTFSICAMAFIADCTLNHFSAILLIYTPSGGIDKQHRTVMSYAAVLFPITRTWIHCNVKMCWDNPTVTFSSNSKIHMATISKEENHVSCGDQQVLYVELINWPARLSSLLTTFSL